MTCPGCGFAGAEGPSCVRCGAALHSAPEAPPAAPEMAAREAGAEPPPVPWVPQFESYLAGGRKTLSPQAALNPLEITTGRLISTTFSTFLSGLPALAPVAAVTQVPLLLDAWLPKFVAGTASLRPVALLLLTFFAGSLSSAALTYGVLAHLRGGVPSLGDCLPRGLRDCLSTLPAALAQSVCLVLSSMTCGITYLFVAPALAVMMPAAVEERLGAGAAIRRSRELTADERGTVLLTCTGVAVVNIAIILPLNLAVRGFTGAWPIAATALRLVEFAFNGGLNATVVVVIYHRLRQAKESWGADDLAAVFE